MLFTLRIRRWHFPLLFFYPLEFCPLGFLPTGILSWIHPKMNYVALLFIFICYLYSYSKGQENTKMLVINCKNDFQTIPCFYQIRQTFCFQIEIPVRFITQWTFKHPFNLNCYRLFSCLQY